MFEGIILRALSIFLLIIMIVQVPISATDSYQETTVMSLAHYAAQKAAPEGYISDSLKAEIVNELKNIGFKEEDINITYTSNRVERGQSINVRIVVPRLPVYFINFGTIEPRKYHVGESTTISEYIE